MRSASVTVAVLCLCCLLAGVAHASAKVSVRKPAPDFRADAVVNGEFQQLALSDFHGKYLVLFFYPLDFTFVCPTEILAFNDRLAEFHELDCEVAAVSVDSKYSHLAWVNTPRNLGGLGATLRLPLISDITRKISSDYGVLDEEEGVAVRALFIISPEGVVRQMTINDLDVGRNVDETLRLVKAFQHSDKFGDVCPAGWRPGEETMVPNVKDSKKYFATRGEQPSSPVIEQ